MVICPIGLVKVKTFGLTQFGKNHQVLTYGYDERGDNLDLYIYDPNYPDNDNVKLSCNTENPEKTANITHSAEGCKVYCILPVPLPKKSPPVL